MSSNLQLSLEQLGLTPDDIADRVVEQITKQLTDDICWDEDGEERSRPSPFFEKMRQRIKEGVDAKVTEIANKHLLPKINEMVENLTLQETTKWGEKVGKPLTFIEYLTTRADAYLREPTDWKGRAKGDPGVDSYNFRATTTRLTGLIHEHLTFSIESAMKAALNDLNKSIAGGLEGAIRLQLAEVAKGVKLVAQASK